ncbi:hypothetical protein MTO96_005649 [Rhipicephalus appendiculatus]
MSEQLITPEVRRDEPSLLHNVAQEELLYMRAKGLSWKEIEEAGQARERRENAAVCLLILGIAGLGCFLVVRLYTILETTAPTEFFVSPEDKPGVLNHTHKWPGALSAARAARVGMVEPEDGSSPGPGSRSGSSSSEFDPEERIRPRRRRPPTRLAAAPPDEEGSLLRSGKATNTMDAPASLSDATLSPTEAKPCNSTDCTD